MAFSISFTNPFKFKFPILLDSIRFRLKQSFRFRVHLSLQYSIHFNQNRVIQLWGPSICDAFPFKFSLQHMLRLDKFRLWTERWNSSVSSPYVEILIPAWAIISHQQVIHLLSYENFLLIAADWCLWFRITYRISMFLTWIRANIPTYGLIMSELHHRFNDTERIINPCWMVSLTLSEGNPSSLEEGTHYCLPLLNDHETTRTDDFSTDRQIPPLQSNWYYFILFWLWLRVFTGSVADLSWRIDQTDQQTEYCRSNTYWRSFRCSTFF